MYISPFDFIFQPRFYPLANFHTFSLSSVISFYSKFDSMEIQVTFFYKNLSINENIMINRILCLITQYSNIIPRKFIIEVYK